MSTLLIFTLFPLILGRVQAENERGVNVVTLNERVAQTLPLLNEAGAFEDIDYASTDGLDWKPLAHLSRVYDYSLAYTMEGSPRRGEAALLDHIARALRYWCGVRPRSDNWWYQQIGECQRLGNALVQLRKEGLKPLDQALETAVVERMREVGGNPAEWTGANKTDIAMHWFYRACLTEDTGLLSQAVAYAYEPVQFATGLESEAGEGIQDDYSYFQHGHQLYFAGYGGDFIKGVTFFALCTAGTPFALPPEKLAIFSEFVRNHFMAVTRGQYILFAAGGRGLMSRRGAQGTGQMAGFAERMIRIDPEHKRDYEDALARFRGKKAPGWRLRERHTHYAIADYTLHIRRAYTFSVRMASTRTGRIEYGNQENLRTYYASDGCTNIAVKGDEYAFIFPVWNWTRVPGVTCVQVPNESIPLLPNQWEVRGTSTFAEGVTDGPYGVTAYAFDADFSGVAAKKAWFFFDDEVVCLGAGITANAASAGLEVNTTLNQCLLRGKVMVSQGGRERALPQGEHALEGADWVLHDGVGYLFPAGGAPRLSARAQSGNWHDINHQQQDKEVTQDVFSLWFDHGKAPSGASYAYTVYPAAKSAARLRAWAKKPPIEILANTPELQAVYHRKLGLLGIVFYQAGVFESNSFRIEADKPCVSMVRGVGSGE